MTASIEEVFDKLFCIQFMRVMQFIGLSVGIKIIRKEKPHRFFPWTTLGLSSAEFLISFVSLLALSFIVFMQFFVFCCSAWCV